MEQPNIEMEASSISYMLMASVG